MASPQEQRMVNYHASLDHKQGGPVAPFSKLVTEENEKDEIGTTVMRTLQDPRAFKVVKQIGYHGCCYRICSCNCCSDKAHERSYRVIGDNYVEINRARPEFCCCCVQDHIEKVFYDDSPFTTICDRCCGGETNGAYITEKDTQFCCLFIPTICCYDMCTKPCFGGFVAKVPCARETTCFFCATRCCRCCIRPIFDFVDESDVVKENIQAQHDLFIKKQKEAGIQGSCLSQMV